MNDQARRAPQRGAGVSHLRVVSTDAHVYPDAPPPHNLSTERAVLSTCFVFATAIDEVMDILVPESFYSEAHRVIFAAMLEVARAGNPIDAVLVRAVLEDRGQLAGIGGSVYLAEIIDASMTRANVRIYAQQIAEYARRRLVIATMQRCASIGYGPDGLGDPEYVDKCVALVARAGLNNTLSTSVSMEDAMDEAMARVAEAEQSSSVVAGVSTGYPGIDLATGGMARGEVILLGAPRKTGKSSLARLIGINVARIKLVLAADAEHRVTKMQEQGVANFSLEMKPWEVARELACWKGRVDGNRVRAKLAQPDEFARLYAAAKYLRGLNFRTVGNRKTTMAEVRTELRAVRARFDAAGVKLSLVIIDTLQILAANEPHDGHGPRDDQKILDKVSKDLGDLAIDFDVPVLVLTQLNAAGAARGSGAPEQNAQSKWRLRVHEDKPANGWPAGESTTPLEADVTFELQRFGKMNAMAPLWWTPAYTDFKDGTQ
jgi:replicative DNA helicase